jgi:NAD(P)-dependent dehydrogenase (short-subunit alcohol dehydrogenase family)
VPLAKFDLTGKVALVTGGNSGIGLGFAEGLAEAGADICIWGRNEKKNADAEAKLRGYGTTVLALRCDVGDPEQVRSCFARTLEVLGRVDACFANAGIGSPGTSFSELGLEEWRTVFNVNMEGVFLTFQTAANHMVERGGGGSLVVTSSGSSMFGAPRSIHYGAAKAGVNSMIRSLAVEYARHGIRANAIIPGWIDTPMTEGFFGLEVAQQKVLKRIPMRRWGVPADFSGLAVYLASDASAYHTGDVMMIDGGYAAF